MTLGETIAQCRRRAGLSQETLAERIGVSRQAVSKWELDEAVPEVDRLVTLAREFHMTVDQLLSGELPRAPETPPAPEKTAAPPDVSGHWGALGRLVRRWGWLAGVYIALSGLGLLVVGSLVCYMFGEARGVANDMMTDWGGGMTWAVEPAGGGSAALPPELAGALFPGGGQADPLDRMMSIPVTIGRVVQVSGLLVLLAGAGLAVFLWKKGRSGG